VGQAVRRGLRSVKGEMAESKNPKFMMAVVFKILELEKRTEVFRLSFYPCCFGRSEMMTIDG
jgi:hypothetical protein